MWTHLLKLPIALGLASSASGAPLAVEFKGSTALGTSAIDQNSVGFTVAGLSGLARVSGERYVAVMDNSNKLVFVDIAIGADGSISTASIPLGIGGGRALADVRDFEDVVFTGVARDRVLLAEEGSPEVRVYTVTSGAFVSAIDRPAIFASRRANFGFESLSLDRTHSRMWTCNEEALTVDGSQSTSAAGTLVRLLKYDFTSEAPSALAQFAYLTEPIHGAVISGARSGVSQVLALPNGKLLVLERSFALGATFFQTRIYEVDISGATDVSAFGSLIGSTYTRATKRLLYKGDQTNLEGLCLGPALSSGGYALLGIVDDGDPISVNRVVAFRLTGDVDSVCPADLNSDGVVDDADFVRFSQSYDLLLDPVGDLNLDEMADDNDFVLFAAAYNELLCSP
ncbi:MAG: esterase-like activity of phytase family protein [Phycisphaeraceae bacterium]|nr:esterase-like activity of phytase family protein [Phycisphaeraceae bacterium]